MKFFKGLHRDNHPSDQPEGTYRDARNILLNEKRGTITNEEGILDTSLLPMGHTPIGKVILPDGRIIVFSASEAGESEIGLIRHDGAYVTLLNDTRLNFSLHHPIQATVRLAPRRFQPFEPVSAVQVFHSEDPVPVLEEVTLIVGDPSPSPSES